MEEREFQFGRLYGDIHESYMVKESELNKQQIEVLLGELIQDYRFYPQVVKDKFREWMTRN